MMPPQKRPTLSTSRSGVTNWKFYVTGRRLFLCCILTIVLLVSVWRKWDTAKLDTRDTPTRVHRTVEPPSWDWLKKWERELPQHDLTLPPPDGSTARYIKFSCQAQQLGWNNVLSELLMNAHLAYESRRGFVFPEFEWEPKHFPWELTDEEKELRQWPPHTPLNALLSGPIVGGAWEGEDDTPRAITPTWFDVVCPPSERRYLNTSDVKKGIEWSEGNIIFDKWATTLRNIPDRCLEIIPSEDDRFPQVFDIWLWGNTRLLSIWDSFSKSPVSLLLKASPIVKAAADRNEYIFLPRGPRPPTQKSVGHSSTYDRVLAMHIRRGDYEGACKHFATWSSTFYGWNQLPFLPDSFTPPPGSSWGENTPENFEIYMRRCLPSIEDVVKKVNRARAESDRLLDVMYLLTNEKGEWLDQLISALENDGWGTIRTSRDLLLESSEQKEVAMAVDMEIARRAAAFVGNGWSSFTSSIVHRRLVDGQPPSSIRFY